MLSSITNQLEKTVGRNHIQTITQVDHDSLHPKTYVNDVIIDFWMLWLSCNSLRNKSCEYFFTSRFYIKLIKGKGGLTHVSGWVTRRKDFHIFEKSIIYFPIVLEKHWSLCVAFSPAKVVELNNIGTLYGTNKVPVIIHLD
jgi:Ulp1 family protease